MQNTHSNTKHEELALEIARGLGEEQFLPIYRSFVLRYSEEVVLRAYQEAIEFPAEKIRKTRGAIFNYLLKKYARQTQSNTQNSGD
jgi:hypothetical protein